MLFRPINAWLNKLLLLLCAVNWFAASTVAYGIEPNKYKELFPRSTSIIDVVEYGSGEDASNVTALTLDKDDRVSVAWIVQNNNQNPRLLRTAEIGKAVWSSGAIDLRKSLPAREIPLSAQRITNAPTGTVFHAVQTAVLVKGEQRRTAGRKIYLFEQKEQKISTALVQEYDLVSTVFLDDVNDDGLPELAVEWIENAGKIGGLDLWSISTSDHLSSLKVPEAPKKYSVDFSTDFLRFEQRYGGPGNRSIIESVCVPGSGHPFTREILYKWDKRSARYKIARVQEIRETRKNLPIDPQ